MLTRLHRKGDLGLALEDVVKAVALWPLWGRLGWNDVRQRYRRSLLGPFWLTISMAVMIAALGIVYGEIFKIPLSDFLPFLSVGLIFWGFISSTLSESCTLFISAEAYIKHVRLPYTLYVLRFVWSRVLILAHNLVIYFVVIVIFSTWTGTVGLYAVPAFLLILLNGGLTSLYLGMVSARFRDLPQIVLNLTQVVFFVTPIMWKPDALPADSGILLYNPFFHILETIRAPLLGHAPSFENWAVVAGVTIANLVFTVAFFARYRARIAYWV